MAPRPALAQDLGHVARNAAAELTGAAATRGKPIELRVEGRCRTVGDARLLGRLLSGLVSVALDEGAPRLPIVLSVVDDGLEGTVTLRFDPPVEAANAAA